MMMKLRGGTAAFQIELRDGKEWREKGHYARNAVEKWKMSAIEFCVALHGISRGNPWWKK